jgi:hypothetical protein
MFHKLKLTICRFYRINIVVNSSARIAHQAATKVKVAIVMAQNMVPAAS